MGSMFTPSGTQQTGQRIAQNAAQGQGNAAIGLAGQGAQNTNAGANYYKSLLSGPAAAQAATAPAARNISDTYAGAKEGVQAGYQQGAQRDTTLGKLALGRTAGIAGLYQGVQPGAASALTGIGGTQTGQGIGAFSGAGNTGLGIATQGAQAQQQEIDNLMAMASGVGGVGSQGIKSVLKMAANAKQAKAA